MERNTGNNKMDGGFQKINILTLLSSHEKRENQIKVTNVSIV